MADPASTADKIINQWNDRLQALADAITANAPQATKLVLESVRVDSISTIVGGFVGLATLVGCAFLGRQCLRWLWAAKESDDPALVVVGLIFSCIIGVIALFVAFFCLCDPWNWITLWRPELWIAHKLLKL